MSRPQQIGKVIQGDAVVTQATWLPNLNFLKKDPKLKVVSTPEAFNFSQPLTLDDTYYSRKAESVSSSQIVDNEQMKYFEFEFYTTSITNTGSWFITIPVLWQITRQLYTINANFNTWIRTVRLMQRSLSSKYSFESIGLDDDYYKTIANVPGPFFIGTDYAARFAPVIPCLSEVFNKADYVAPNQWQLQLIKQCEIELGNNRIPIGNANAVDISIIKALNSLVIQDDTFVSLHGLYNYESGYSSNNNYAGIMMDKHLRAFYENLATGPNPNDPLNTWNQRDDPAIVIPLQIPIKMLNSFFHIDRWMPAGLLFKIKLTMSEINQVIMMSNTIKGTMEATNDWGLDWALECGVIDLKLAKLHYMSHILRQPIEDSINKRWLADPYLYNYVTSDVLFAQTNGVSTNFNFNIAINQEVPLQLIIYLEKMSSYNSLNETKYPIIANKKYFYGVTDENVAQQFDRMQLVDGLPTTGFGSFMYTYNESNTPLPMLLYAYTLNINGVRRISHSLAQKGSLLSTPTGEQLLEDMITLNSFNPKLLRNKKSIRNTNYGIGNYFHLTLDPGLYVDIDYRSTSVGSQVATLELEIYDKGIIATGPGNRSSIDLTPQLFNADEIMVNKRPIAPGYVIKIVKIMPEQMRLDMNRNVTKVKFPAVASSDSIQAQMSSIINQN